MFEKEKKMPLIQVKEVTFITIEELNEYLDKNKIKKANIISVENISKEDLYIGEKKLMYRLIYIIEREMLNE